MKRRSAFAICILLISAFLGACGTNSKDAAAVNPAYPTGTALEYIAQLDPGKKPIPDDASTKALNDFSYATCSKILSGQSKNVNFSPISLYMALSLAGTGAKGETQDEIYSVLGVKKKGTNFLSEQNSNLFRFLYSDNEISKLMIANSLWLQKDVVFKDAFKTNAANNFYASLFNVDFASPSTGKLMGEWISENTKGILSPDIRTYKSEIMSIINTIYFKDEWVDKFDENNTKPDTFYLADGDKVKCDFMNMTFHSGLYIKGDGFISSSLSLKNRGSMVFILPDKDTKIEDLISTPQKIAKLFDLSHAENGKVIFQIPKFSFGATFDLNKTLQSLGIESAFADNADFTGMTDNKAFISSVKQESHIAIDEKGVEAAAFTQIVCCGALPPTGKVAEMILNRPFIYAITSNHGEILFMGIVNNPTDK